VRRALAAALDKDVVLERASLGNARRLDTPVLNGWWAASQDITWYPPDPAGAAASLDSLGYRLQPDGIRAQGDLALNFTLLTDTNPDRLAAAAEIARQWELLGVRITVEPLEPAALQERLQSHTFSMALHGWQRLGADPDSLFNLWHSAAAENGANYAGLNDPQIDIQLEDARNNPDIVARSLAYATFQRRWVTLVPGIVIYQPLFLYTADATLGGLAFLPRTNAPPPILIGREARYYQVNRWYTQRAREIQGDLRQNP
jgi:peptide/nickel transport system substrate-binding protein